MRKLFRLLLPVTVGLVVSDCGDFRLITGLPRELSVAEANLIQADNRFAFKLFREINAQDTTGGNIFVSPLSVAMALGMTYNGAAGTTREAMQATLELQGMTLQEVNESYRSLIDMLRDLDPHVEFTLANSIWHDLKYTPLPAFLDATLTYFDAEVAALDFGSADAVPTINNWVSEATRGKIDTIIESIPLGVIAYLINAIYFKGNWTYQFDKDETKDAPFRLADGSEVSVDMMSYAEETPIRFAYDEGYQIVDLPYGGQAYSMTIVLPPEPSDADALAEELTQERWDAWVAALDSTSRYVSMPKYTLEYDVTLNDVLKALGMAEAFDQTGAHFENMFGTAGVFINRVLHKTYVDVNEEGTEAAAVTAVEMALTSLPPRTVVDRPFLFAIRENYSGTILFMGKMVDPTAG